MSDYYECKIESSKVVTAFNVIERVLADTSQWITGDKINVFKTYVIDVYRIETFDCFVINLFVFYCLNRGFQ
jgi:hypothetical protein